MQSRAPERDTEEKQRKGDIGPRVDWPLILPCDAQAVVEGSEILNGPEVVRRWPPRADDVAEQVQVKGEETEKGCAPALDARGKQNRRAQGGAEKAMKQRMVIRAVQECLRSAEDSVAEIRDDAETVKIWSYARPRDEVAISCLAAAEVADLPAEEKVRDGIHSAAGLTRGRSAANAVSPLLRQVRPEPWRKQGEPTR